MIKPNLTEQEQKDLNQIYSDWLKEGITLYTYTGEEPKASKEQFERYYSKIKERFGEDSEITKYLMQG